MAKANAAQKKVRFKDLSFWLKTAMVWGFITLGLYVLGLIALLAGVYQ